MYVFWHGRGYWVIFLAAAAMFLPLIVLRQVDGPEVDRGVCLTMGLAAITALGLGLRWNRGETFGPAARDHAFFGIPMQLWALPMALFAILLGTGTITTEEAPRQRPTAQQFPDGTVR
ncbi:MULTISPECIES: hypothetical protein [Methylobacterium]|uniref:Uncharacterized protein n=1 Tax=Methylobacterium thuringiense TaxID=1003091 RepID=A0ABQ4TJQ5_9HYPH|nr:MULTISPECIES: hypothetical protein [Methylobacterium]TXN23944.1 hypothetical protein FV217_04555 [Methylobacterium sp. WL9]GJE55211.1 hypothetical protein EKPJFOCH_1700 [Methylobacterium thuringiense]